MISARIVAMSFFWVVIWTPLLSAQDLSRYREFQLGTSLAAVAQQAGVTPEAHVLHQRPELIQELMWQPPRGLATSLPGDSVRKVLLSFYTGQLFRIAVSYEWDRTEGLTVEDMVDALSGTYGPATLPANAITSSLSRVSTDSDRIVAHWEDPQHSLNLVRPSYASTFGLVMFSKRLDALARAATVEAIRLDEQEAHGRRASTDSDRIAALWQDPPHSLDLVRPSYASTFGLVMFSKRMDAPVRAAAVEGNRLDEQEVPGRAIERKRMQEDEDHARQEKARTRNKATFRP